MGLSTGPAFAQASPTEVADYLRRRLQETITVTPERLHVVPDGDGLVVEIQDGSGRSYPMRQAFLDKLLRWHLFPSHVLRRLTVDTAVSLVNDLLLSIRAPIVRVIVEDGEAVSITSTRYAEFGDLEILRMCEPFGIASVSRTDWFMRVYTQIGYRTEPVAGDVCGFGFNIFNSETGFRPVSVEHYVLRYVCSNGAVVKQTGGHAGRSHHGHSPEELRRFVAARLEQGTRAREVIVQNIRKSAGTAATEEERFRLSRELRRNATYTRELRDLIEQASTRYDLFNLVTAIARPLAPPQRLRLEEFAGGMMR